MALTATIANQGASSVSFNEKIPLLVVVSNSGGSAVTLTNCQLKVDFPADSSSPVTPCALSNIQAQNISVPAGGTANVPCSATIFGHDKPGTYTIDVLIQAAGESITSAGAVSVTLA